jgi:hypothetical protein
MPPTTEPLLPAPRNMHSLDRALEVFRVSWRRSAQAHLGVGIIGLCTSLALVSSVFSLVISGLVLSITSNSAKFPARMASFTSASKWQTKGVVAAGGRLASLKVLSTVLRFAIAVDLAHSLVWLSIGGSSIGPDYEGETWCPSSSCSSLNFGLLVGTVTCTQQQQLVVSGNCWFTGPSSGTSCALPQWLFVSTYFAATGLVVLLAHFALSFSVRAFISDAEEWLTLLPRPSLPPPIMWDSVQASPTHFMAGDGGKGRASSEDGVQDS